MDFKSFILEPLFYLLFGLSIFGIWKLVDLGLWTLHLIERCSP